VLDKKRDKRDLTKNLTKDPFTKDSPTKDPRRKIFCERQTHERSAAKDFL